MFGSFFNSFFLQSPPEPGNLPAYWPAYSQSSLLWWRLPCQASSSTLAARDKGWMWSTPSSCLCPVSSMNDPLLPSHSWSNPMVACNDLLLLLLPLPSLPLFPLHLLLINHPSRTGHLQIAMTKNPASAMSLSPWMEKWRPAYMHAAAEADHWKPPWVGRLAFTLSSTQGESKT